MSYAVVFTPHAERDILQLDNTVAKIIINRVEWLAENIEDITPIPLKGKFKGKYKLRVGRWRIIYSIEHAKKTIVIYAIRHRKEVYKL